MRRFIVMLWLVLSMAPGMAMTLAPPQPIAIPFEAGSERLGHAGMVAVDSLAIRAAQCGSTALRVRLMHSGELPAERVAARFQAVRQRMALLGLRAIYVVQPLRRSDPGGDSLLAQVDAAGDAFCQGAGRFHLDAWALELARHADQPSRRQPAFWRQMTAEGRRELALPLARTAYCLLPACEHGRALFHWLASQLALQEPVERRRDWLLVMWLQGSDEDLTRLQQTLGVELTARDRASVADLLADGALPWAVIERRLLEPDVMAAFAERPSVVAGPGPHRLLAAATRHAQLDSFDRLIDAAGPAKSCFTDRAFWMAGGLEDEFEAWKAHFTNWARGGTGPFRPKGAPYVCDPVATVMREAFCLAGDAEVTARYVALWDVLIQAGAQLDSPGVRELTAPTDARPWCKLEPMPGSRSRFRNAAQP